MKKSVGIFTYKVQGVLPWDSDSVHSGVTGSEEAVIFMAQKLALRNLTVTVLGNPPLDSPHSQKGKNPRFIDIAFFDGSPFDIAICWRMPDKAQDLKPYASKIYLWPHDTYRQVLTEEQIDGFDDVLWLSHWQREYWIHYNPGFAKFTQIIGNGINPETFMPVEQRKNPYSCIYASNYARGLEVLLDIWPKVKQEFSRATLDIYYGWQHWGLLSPEKEAKMRRQIQTLATLEVRDQGLVGHETLNQAFAAASLWTYPTILPEVFCITALRAQMSGCLPVIINDSALQETVRFGYKCASRDDYLATLLQAMGDADKISLQERQIMGDFVRQEFTWNHIADKWQTLFDKHEIK